MRETRNIFYYLSVRNYKVAYHLLLNIRRDRYVWPDSRDGFIKITYCKLFKHNPDYSNIGGMDSEQDISCKHCGEYLRSLSYEEHKKMLRKQKFKRLIK